LHHRRSTAPPTPAHGQPPAGQVQPGPAAWPAQVSWTCGGSHQCWSRLLRAARAGPPEICARFEDVLSVYGPRLWRHVGKKTAKAERKLLKDPDVRRYICRWNCDEAVSLLFGIARATGTSSITRRITARSLALRYLAPGTLRASIRRLGLPDDGRFGTGDRDPRLQAPVRLAALLGERSFNRIVRACGNVNAILLWRNPEYADHVLNQFPWLHGNPVLPPDATRRHAEGVLDGRRMRGAIRRAKKRIAAGIPVAVPPILPPERLAEIEDSLRRRTPLPFDADLAHRPPEVDDNHLILQVFHDCYRDPLYRPPKTRAVFVVKLARALRPAAYQQEYGQQTQSSTTGSGIATSSKVAAGLPQAPSARGGRSRPHADVVQAAQRRFSILRHEFDLVEPPDVLRRTRLFRLLDWFDVYARLAK
jgi:hypothetical protein